MSLFMNICVARTTCIFTLQVDSQPAVDGCYHSRSRPLCKHICVSVVKPFLLHPPSINFMVVKRQRASSSPLIMLCLPKTETWAQLLLLTTWTRSCCPKCSISTLFSRWSPHMCGHQSRWCEDKPVNVGFTRRDEDTNMTSWHTLSVYICDLTVTGFWSQFWLQPRSSHVRYSPVHCNCCFSIFYC